MRPLIFEYIEEPKAALWECELEYSSALNLTVLKGTVTPAIGFANLSTETFTKADTEGSDSDNSFSQLSATGLDTMTGTLNYTETTDSDADIRSMMLDTMTGTRTLHETSDNDPDIHRLMLATSTEKFTEAREESDADL